MLLIRSHVAILSKKCSVFIIRIPIYSYNKDQNPYICHVVIIRRELFRVTTTGIVAFKLRALLRTLHLPPCRWRQNVFLDWENFLSTRHLSFLRKYCVSVVITSSQRWQTLVWCFPCRHITVKSKICRCGVKSDENAKQNSFILFGYQCYQPGTTFL